jgi:hypothetical protein
MLRRNRAPIVAAPAGAVLAVGEWGVPAIYSAALIVITLVICLSALIGPLR